MSDETQIVEAGSTLPSRRAALEPQVVNRAISTGKKCHHCGDALSTMKCPACRKPTCYPYLHDCMAVHRCGARDAPRTTVVGWSEG
jgi:hypothetical protein